MPHPSEPPAHAPKVDSSSGVEPPAATPVATPIVKRKHGFATMDPALVRQIASKGGKSAHAAGTAHEFTSDEARTAGSKGGRVAYAKRKASKKE
jgi:general stress protein YciG